MHNPILDIQDKMSSGLVALEGLRDLLCEMDVPGKTHFDGLTPAGMAALVTLVEAPLRQAGQMLDVYARSCRR